MRWGGGGGAERKGAPPHHHGSAPEGGLAGLSAGASAGPAPSRAGVSLGALERAHQPLICLLEGWSVGL